MPRRDGTGPMGMGPRTGRGMGFCNVARVAVSVIGGLGLRLGLGRKRGLRRHSFNNKMISRNRRNLIMKEKRVLENRLNKLNNQLNTFHDNNK